MAPPQPGRPRIVNWHAHSTPPEERRGMWMFEPQTVVGENQAAGVDTVVVSNTIHYVKGRSRSACLDAIKRWTEYAAEIKATYGAAVEVLASSIPGGGPDFLRELERAVREYGARGCLINSSHDGQYPDEDAARPFWEMVVELDIPVMIHAPHASFGEDRMDMYRLISSVGRPMDECLALARLIVRGLWERYPDLKVVGAHGGGGICEVIGRMDYAYELEDFCSFLGSYEPKLIQRKPSDYLAELWIDTANYWPPALLSDVQSVGVAHTLFGADAPPLLPLLPKAIRLVRELPLSEADKDAIYHANAERLLGSSVAV